MKRGCYEKSHETSPSQTRLCHGVDIDIPLDITVEILKKLPTKSLMRFQCVSKLWSSIISSCRDFIDSIMTRSLSQSPRDVHLMYHDSNSGKCFLASISATDQDLVLPPGDHHQFVRGLICIWSCNYQTFMSEVAIYNPTTRQSIYLPKLKKIGAFLLGYDPLENQYKIVFLPRYGTNESCRVFTLGDPTGKQWRKIQGIDEPRRIFKSVVCINGIVYYREYATNTENYGLMSFDVRSEKFYRIGIPKKITMFHIHKFPINYEGKLGFISCEKGVEIWVMETQGWSKIFFCQMDGFERLRISGATHTGEIVFVDYSMYLSDPTIRVYYYDPKRICMRYVVCKDYYYEKGSHSIPFSVNTTSVFTLPDYVENTTRLKL